MLKTFYVFIITAILSIGNHFLYNYSGKNKFISNFSPTNESMFQHMKMLVYPFILSIIPFIYFFNKFSIFAFSIGLLVSFTLIPCIFYLYTNFTDHNLGIDITITLFVIYMGVNVWVELNTLKNTCKTNMIGVTILVSILSWITSCNYRECDDIFREE